MAPTQIEELRQWRQQAHEKHLYATAQLLGDKILALSEECTDAYWLAQAYHASGNYLRAADLLTRREDHRHSQECRYLAIRCLVEAEKLDEAQKLIDTPTSHSNEILADAFDDTEVAGIAFAALISFLQGRIYALQSRFDEARESYVAALRADPRCFEAFDQLTSHEMLAPKDEWQLLQSMDFHRLGESADLIRAVYGVRMSKLANIEEFAKSVQLMTDVYGLGNSEDVVIARAEHYFLRSYYTEACRLCEDLLARDPHNIRVYPMYIACLHETEQYNELYRLAHELVGVVPEEAVSWLAIGTYYLGIVNPQEARKAFSHATTLEPDSSNAWLGFAHSFAQEGEHEQAIVAYTAAARMFPASHMPYLYLGMQHLQLNNFGAAEQYLKTAQSLFSDDPLLLNEQGVVAYHKNDMNRAVECLQRALQKASSLECERRTHTCIQANLAYAYRRIGNLETARAYFEEVTRAAPLDASILTALGLVLLQLGEVDASVARLNQALSLSRDDPVTGDILKRAIEASISKSRPTVPKIRELDVEMIS